jgi:hypothetical protein
MGAASARRPREGNERARMGLLALKAPWALACAAALLSAGMARADDVPGAAASLQARYAAFKAQGVQDTAGRPLQLESSEGAGAIAGEIHALVDSPFAVAATALDKPSQWCDILMLHLDTKTCVVSSEGNATVVKVGIVRKYSLPATDAYLVGFGYRVAEETASFLRVNLDADVGPLGTSNYRIVLEAMPADHGRTFLRMSYSYSHGVLARVAMQAYLATFGRNKVGFTVVATEPGGQPRYMGGMRGVVERNTMRYYLAIEAYLAAQSTPQSERLDKSLQDWYSAIERYPRQLHEMGEAEYLEMKRKEFALQRTGPA